jgi:hydrogenase expression/formation protein HypD
MDLNAETDALARGLKGYDGPEIRIMEVCGTHTHENYRLGIRALLPDKIKLIAGPGCPVCVTPSTFVDKAVWLAQQGVTVCTFGDLVRVPGAAGSLAAARAGGGDIRICYSPLDAVDAAASQPGKQTVFLAVGFETTAPANCLAIKKAQQAGLRNFSLLCACKTMEQAYYKLRGAADAFLYPGHVSAITGMDVYRRLLKEDISGAVAGFTAAELLTALTVITEHLRRGDKFAVNCYTRVVADDGNPAARKLIAEVMEPCGAVWRGIGPIEGSGLAIRDSFADYDAEKRFSIPEPEEKEPAGCRCGTVLRGECAPHDCPLFGKTCTPEHPVGACMVSGEGACAAAYKYGRLQNVG